MNAMKSHAELCVCVFFWGGFPSFHQILRGVPDPQKVKDCWSQCAATHMVYVAWPVLPIVDGRTSLEFGRLLSLSPRPPQRATRPARSISKGPVSFARLFTRCLILFVSHIVCFLPLRA